jgi:hypothetical protein
MENAWEVLAEHPPLNQPPSKKTATKVQSHPSPSDSPYNYIYGKYADAFIQSDFIHSHTDRVNHAE